MIPGIIDAIARKGDTPIRGLQGQRGIFAAVWLILCILIFFSGHPAFVQLPLMRPCVWVSALGALGLALSSRKRFSSPPRFFLLAVFVLAILVLIWPPGPLSGQSVVSLCRVCLSALGALSLQISALGLGVWILNRLGLKRPSGMAGLSIPIALGWVGLEMVLFLLGQGPGFPKWLLVLGVVPLACLGVRDLLSARSEWRGSSLSLGPFAMVAVLAVASSVLAAGAPPADWDVLAYHLDIPKRYLQSGHMIAIPHHYNANMPHGGELLYVLPLSLLGPTACQMLHGQFGLLSILSLGLLSLEAPSFSWMAVMASCPLFLNMSATANVELLLAFFFSAGCAICLSPRIRTDDPQRTRWAWVVGLLAGACFTVKYTGVWYAVGLLILASGTWGLRAGLLGSCMACLPTVPWLARALLLTGNPVFPTLYDFFGGRGWSSVQSQQLSSFYHSIGMGRDLKDVLLLPFRLLYHSRWEYARFNGIVTPLGLGLFPWIWMARRYRIAAGVVTLIFILWALTVQNLRYLVPLVPLVSVLGLLTLERMGKGWLRSCCLGGILVTGFLLSLGGWIHRAPALAEATGRMDEQAYLSQNVAGYELTTLLNQEEPQPGGVLAVWWNQGYYLEPELWSDLVFEASWIFQMLHECAGPLDIQTRMQELKITRILLWRPRMLTFRPTPVPGYGDEEYRADIQKLDAFLAERATLISSKDGFELYALSGF